MVSGKFLPTTPLHNYLPSLSLEREVYIEELLRTLSGKEVEILDTGKELVTLQTKLLQTNELMTMEKERAQKLEQELFQRLDLDKNGTNMSSVMQEILNRVSSESVSKAGT
jgi:hypothetical protein